MRTLHNILAMNGSRILAMTCLVALLHACGSERANVEQEAASTVEHDEAGPTISTFTTRPLVIAFTRGDSIWIQPRGSRAVARGRDPEVSPDGRFVAITDKKQNGAFSIGIIDTVSLQVRWLRSLTGRSSLGPRWAPDGKRLAFLHSAEHALKVGIINADDSDFRLFDAAFSGQAPEGLHSLCWTRDGNALLSHDARSMYEFDLDGKLLASLPLNMLLGPDSLEYGITAQSRLATSGDGNLIVFDAERKGTPIRAVFCYDRRARRARMISPSNYYAKAPAMLPSNRSIFMSGFELTKTNRSRVLANQPVETNIYSINTDGTNLEVVIRNADYPSTSR